MAPRPPAWGLVEGVAGEGAGEIHFFAVAGSIEGGSPVGDPPAPSTPFMRWLAVTTGGALCGRCPPPCGMFAMASARQKSRQSGQDKGDRSVASPPTAKGPVTAAWASPA